MSAAPGAVPELSPGEWAVLGAVGEGPTHGFALARLLGPGGGLGRIWTLPRPVVYQALAKLVGRGLVEAVATQRSDRGPQRTIVAATPAGRCAVERWLAAPVDHVRDVRSELLLKLALHDRSGSDPGPLIEAQRAALCARLESLQALAHTGEGFEQLLAVWRVASVRAVLDFLTAAGARRDS